MYYAMHGQIEKMSEGSIIINVHDISYEILTSHPEYFALNETATIYLYEVIREDDHYLVGFKSLEEKSVFLSLISVKGIGPKTALGALNQTTPMEFITAIENNDLRFLKKLPGIGSKAAQQIVLDLKGHLTLMDDQKSTKAPSESEQEVIEALKTLGFKASDIDRTLKQIDHQNKDSESLLKEALKMLRK